MVSTRSLCLLCIHLCWGLAIASDNSTEIRVQHKGVNVLEISCHISNTPNRKHVKLTIFENTPNNTLVMVTNGDWPIVEASARAKQIYLRPRVPNEKLHSLDILLLNYNPADNSRFGCNYTYLKDDSYIQHSVSFVSTAEITKFGIVNQTNFTSYPTEEGTISLTTSTSTDKRPDSGGSGFNESYLLVAGLIISTAALLLLIIYFIVMSKAIRQKSSFIMDIYQSGNKQAKHNNKIDTDDPYTEIKNTSKEDNDDQDTAIQALNILFKGEHDHDYTYSTVNKLKNEETLVDLAPNL